MDIEGNDLDRMGTRRRAGKPGWQNAKNPSRDELGFFGIRPTPAGLARKAMRRDA